MIGRVLERKSLMRAVESDESQFVVVYGRRRIGKTYLVRETIGGVNKNCKARHEVRCAVGRGVPTAPQPPYNEIAFSDGFGAMGTSRPTDVRAI